MKEIEKILQKLEHCIVNNTYIVIEDDHCELKDNSSENSHWKQVFITACAFLNTRSGIIITGIWEDKKNKKYVLTGYDERQEEKIRTIHEQFTDDEGLKMDLKDYFHFSVVHLLDKPLLAIYVNNVPDDKQYVFFNNIAYERRISSDEKIDVKKIQTQKEYKKELENARELWPVPNATINDINLNKLNDFIATLNKEYFYEAAKADIDSAKSFLLRKSFINKNLEATLLGVLVCGNHTDDLLGNRCQVDCYVDSLSLLADNKKIIKDNILPLMEKSIAFVMQNIKVGISVESGGRSLPEYPENLIRESINNSLAHRDYSIPRSININIVPNKHIEIRNPGRFKEELLITDIKGEIKLRRIIPGNPKANNPKLAEILKIFDKWEGRGLGMSTLTKECLENKIDLPFYRFHSKDELSLYIPTGRLLDERMKVLFESYSGYIRKKLKDKSISEEQQLVLSFFFKSEVQNRNDRYTILLTSDNNHLEAISSLETAGLIIRHDLSNEFNTIFIIDRALFREDFSSELRQIFGADYGILTQERKDILQEIYICNNYSDDPYPNANRIGNMLWAKKGKAGVLEGIEDFKRDIRRNMNAMEKRGIIKIIRKEKNRPLYIVNEEFEKKQRSLYENI